MKKESWSLIKVVAIAGCFMCLAFCSDKGEFSPSIVGIWHGKKYPQNVYEFRENGSATSRVIFSGQTIYQNEYAYWVKSDTLEMLDIEQKTRIRYLVQFQNDSTAILSNMQAGVINTIVRFK